MLSWASCVAFACRSAWAAKHRPPHIHKHTLMLVKHFPSCICIRNKQEIVFICMQMILSPRQRFWIKSFPIPLIPNYSQAQTRTAIFAVTERISTEGGSSSQNSCVWLGCVSVPICTWRHNLAPSSGPDWLVVLCPGLHVNYPERSMCWYGVIDIPQYFRGLVSWDLAGDLMDRLSRQIVVKPKAQ